MIPAFVGAGIIGGIAAVMSNLVVAGDISASWQQYIDVLNIIKMGFFAYLALYTGINSASVFGATPALGGVIGAVTMLTGMNRMLQSVIFSLGNIICRTRRNYRCYFCRMVIIIVRKTIA